jgi:hypothetical protein
MSHENESSSIDLVRWTFATNPDRRAEIQAHLVDLGLDVEVHEDANFVVNWEEPDPNFEEVIEEVWELNGQPFEVTQEEFHRLGVHTLHHVDDEAQAA